MKKKMSKKGIAILVITLTLVGVVGAAAALTKGFTSFNIAANIESIKEKVSKDPEKINYRSFNFANKRSSELDETSLLNYVNTHNVEKKEVFSFVPEVELADEETLGPCIANVYLDGDLGIRLGNEEEGGYFGLTCVDSYKFDHLRIRAVNYHKFDEDNEQYDKEVDGSILTVNGLSYELKASASLDKPDVAASQTFIFEEPQSELYILGTQGRPCVLNLELWSE